MEIESGFKAWLRALNELVNSLVGLRFLNPMLDKTRVVKKMKHDELVMEMLKKVKFYRCSLRI